MDLNKDALIGAIAKEQEKRARALVKKFRGVLSNWNANLKLDMDPTDLMEALFGNGSYSSTTPGKTAKT